MSVISDGGSAYPIETTATPWSPGLSIRDWLAGQALANPYTFSEVNPDKIAEWAYQVADAMLFERSKGNTE